MRKRTEKNILLGATAGLAGTALVQGMMAVSRKVAPETLPPLKDDPGHFMVEQAERVLPEQMQGGIPKQLENAASFALAFGYGTTFAALYAAIASRRRNLWIDGAALGGITWAVGYLGWLPATKLMPPIWKQKTKQVVPNILSHVLFGIFTVGVFNWLRRKT